MGANPRNTKLKGYNVFVSRAKPLAMAGHYTELEPVGRFGNTTHPRVLAAAQQIPRILVGRRHTPHARPSILLRCTPKTKIAYCPMPGCVALTQMLKEKYDTFKNIS